MALEMLLSKGGVPSQDHAIAAQGDSPMTHYRRFRFFPSSRWATSPLSGTARTLSAAVTCPVWWKPATGLTRCIGMLRHWEHTMHGQRGEIEKKGRKHFVSLVSSSEIDAPKHQRGIDERRGTVRRLPEMGDQEAVGFLKWVLARVDKRMLEHSRSPQRLL
jgi:hypothetical protein